MYHKAILHLDLDTFFASVEIMKNSRLAGLPVVVAGLGGRSIVHSCNYEARHFGIHAGMPLSLALRRCPGAKVLRGDFEDYEKYSGIVTEIIAEAGPVFEKAALDAFYLDLTGMDKHLGCVRWGQELRQRISRETGLPLSAGLAVNKLVAKVRASEAKPNGSGWVAEGAERAFLAPLPVGKIPSVGRETARKLSLLGIRQTGTLSQVPVALLEREFGKPGRELHLRANGIDHRPVVPYNERSFFSSEHSFDTDTIEVEVLRRCLRDLTMRLAFDLRQASKLTAAITVKIRYTDGNTYTRSRRLPYTAHDQQLLPAAEQLFSELFTRRQCIRLLGIRFERLAAGHSQLDLFADTAEDSALLQALDKVRKRFGKDAVGRG
ncbi:DNA polymerase IV [Neolewinella lacunae]|uniref:DNA polymerase IV n=1 Tax=Neolewinella lacunae TaxID=1517758 RepID=A0A923T9K6_9BACT|nr:DNA polymerase IV [Neolewinella lacunae]MBC6996820.1 DNA polymerase IV [Neolewinella lacunae]MDN3633798.1 DNA polymerase IV [Neolewinella lacunae]